MPALQEAPPKSCPKCRGSMIVERDWHGTYGSCIMCGYVHEVLTSPPVDLAAEEAAHTHVPALLFATWPPPHPCGSW